MDQINSSLSFLGLLIIALGCIAHYLGEKKTFNPFVGFRIPPTYRSPEIWMAVNMRAGVLFIFHGIFVAIAGLILPKVELLIFLLILLLPLAAVIIYGTWYAYKLEKAKFNLTERIS